MTVKSTIAFEVIAALVTQGTTALTADENAIVLNGYGTTEWGGDFILIGAADPFSDGSAVAIESDQQWAYANTTVREESGHVNCVAYVRNGDGDSLAAQARLKVLCDALATVVRENYSLGIAELLWTGFTVTQIDHDQDDDGAWAVANIHILFKAQI